MRHLERFRNSLCFRFKCHKNSDKSEQRNFHDIVSNLRDRHVFFYLDSGVYRSCYKDSKKLKPSHGNLMFVCKHQETHDKVIIKLNDKRVKVQHRDPKNAARIRAELGRHIELCETNSHYISVFNFIAGKEFFEYLEPAYANQIIYPIEFIMNFIISTLQCLDIIHRKYAHLDLKPSNILTQNDGQSEIIDFDISREVDLVDQIPRNIGHKLFNIDEPRGRHCDILSLGRIFSILLMNVISAKIDREHSFGYTFTYEPFDTRPEPIPGCSESNYIKIIEFTETMTREHFQERPTAKECLFFFENMANELSLSAEGIESKNRLSIRL